MSLNRIALTYPDPRVDIPNITRLQENSRSRPSSHLRPSFICVNYFFGFQIPHAFPRHASPPLFFGSRSPPPQHASWLTGRLIEQTSPIPTTRT